MGDERWDIEPEKSIETGNLKIDVEIRRREGEMG